MHYFKENFPITIIDNIGRENKTSSYSYCFLSICNSYMRTILTLNHYFHEQKTQIAKNQHSWLH